MTYSILSPRELLERAIKANAIARMNAIELADGWRALEEIKALLAQPASGLKPVEDEPVAWRQFDGEGNYDFTDDEEAAERMIKHNGPKYADWCQPLFLRPAPAGVVLPTDAAFHRFMADKALEKGPYWVWNACREETARLNGVKP